MWDEWMGKLLREMSEDELKETIDIIDDYIERNRKLIKYLKELRKEVDSELDADKTLDILLKIISNKDVRYKRFNLDEILREPSGRKRAMLIRKALNEIEKDTLDAEGSDTIAKIHLRNHHYKKVNERLGKQYEDVKKKGFTIDHIIKTWKFGLAFAEIRKLLRHDWWALTKIPLVGGFVLASFRPKKEDHRLTPSEVKKIEHRHLKGRVKRYRKER